MAVCLARNFHSDGRGYLCRVDFVARRGACEVRVFGKGLRRVVTGAIQVGDESAHNEKTVKVGALHGVYGRRTNFNSGFASTNPETHFS